MVHDANKLLQGPQSVDPSRHSQQRIRAYRSNRQDAAWPCRVVGGAHECEPPVIRVTGPISRAARDAANGLVAALLAPACAVCSALLDAPLSGCVCSNCWRSIRPITPPICDRCGDSLARTSQSLIPSPQPLTPNPQSLVGNPRSLVCAQCRKGVGAVDRARAVGEYEGALREVVHALKYSRRHSLARPLAERMRQRGAELIEDAECVVPVPLHWRREHQRGFNQAREIARHLGPPVVDALVRHRATRAQVELAADRRRANVEGAFGINLGWFRRVNVKGRSIALVDDVSTTGATLEACARVLKESGASQVYALTAARVATRRHTQHPIPNP
jgi:ComF family protein